MNRRRALLALGLVTLIGSGACAKSESAPATAAASGPEDRAKAASGPAPGAAAPEAPQAAASASPAATTQPREVAPPAAAPARATDKTSSHGGVSAGEAQVSVGLSPEVIHNTVKANFDKVQACYDAGLRGNPALQGRVTVKLVIGTNGSPKSAIASPGDFPDKSVVDCIGRAFQSLKFPPPSRGDVTVSYPVMLSPST
jgi:hypothetical protein